MNKKIGIIGAGGHSKIIIDIINELKCYEIVGIFDDNKIGNFCNLSIIGKINEISNYPNIDCFVLGIGNIITKKLINDSYHNIKWETLIHPKSIISKTSQIGDGTIVCAGAVIQTDTIIGKHCIINTNCSIDHECYIGDFTSISPGATICGQVNIGNLNFIGANSVIIQNITIGNECIIGAGSVIIRNIDDNLKVVGNPGRVI